MTEVHLPQVIQEAVGWSRSVARAAIAQGKVRVDGEVVEDCDVPAGFEELTVGTLIVDSVYYNPALALERGAKKNAA